jgi:superfamily II DNA or RNA helicase
MITLRDYQLETVDSIESHYAFGTETLVVKSPGGSGKAVMLCAVAEKFKDVGVMIVISFSNLLDQLDETLSFMGIEHSVLKAGQEEKFDPSQQIQLVMAQTFFARQDKIKFKHHFDIVQIDEGHVAWTGERTRIILASIRPTLTVLWSATPWTANGYALDKVDDSITVATVEELTKAGHLSPLKFYVPKWSQELSYDDLPLVAGEYAAESIEELVGSDSYIQLTVNSMIDRGYKDKKVAVFTNSIATADLLNEALLKAGFRSFAYHSKAGDETTKLMYHFKNGGLMDENLFHEGKEPPLCVVSVSKISIGWDVPDLHAGVLCRPTKRRSLYYQMALRLTRTAPGKEYGEILDLSGLIERLGFPDTEYVPAPAGDKEALKRLNEEHAVSEVNFIHSKYDEKAPLEITRELVLSATEEIKKAERHVRDLSSSQLAALFTATNDLFIAVKIAYEFFFRKYGFYYADSEVEDTVEPLENMINDIPEYRSRLMVVFKRNLQRKVQGGRRISEIKTLPEFVKDKAPYVYAYRLFEERSKTDVSYDIVVEDEFGEEIPF